MTTDYAGGKVSACSLVLFTFNSASIAAYSLYSNVSNLLSLNAPKVSTVIKKCLNAITGK